MEETTQSSAKLKLPEPIQGSIFLLVSRFLAVMVGIDTIYIVLRIFVFDLHERFISLQNIDIGFLLLLVGSYIFQIFLILTVLFHWLNKRYYIQDSHLIVKDGVFTKKLRVYDLKNVKTVMVSQDLFGKMFHYGTVTVVITSPGLKEEVYLSEIPNPQEIEERISAFI